MLGVREYALQAGGRFQAVEEEWVEDWISGHQESNHFVHPRDGTPDAPTFSLFAFPAEENFSGVKYPLRWIREIQVCRHAAIAVIPDVCLLRCRRHSRWSGTCMPWPLGACHMSLWFIVVPSLMLV